MTALDAEEAMPWRADGACVDMDPELFFPARGEAIPGEVIEACANCPVLAECREWSIHHERYGYWAGMSERSRRKLRRVLHITLADEVHPTGDTAA